VLTTCLHDDPPHSRNVRRNTDEPRVPMARFDGTLR
jgi:hypothetical protein